MGKTVRTVMVLWVAAFFMCGLSAAEVLAADKLKVAFVYNASVGDYGWFYGHDKARKLTQEALSSFVKTSRLENVKPGAQAERVFGELCEENYQVVIAVSNDYEADVLKVAAAHPEVIFLICAGTVRREPNVESFFPRREQIWYILGQVAAKLTKTNTIGMVGAMPFPLSLHHTNAWLLGARSINPKIVERLIFVNTFYDPAAERDAALSLIDAGADVLCQGTNTPAHVQAAEEMGVYAMSAWENMAKFGPKSYVTGEVYQWEQYYIATLKAIREGTWKPRLYYPELGTKTLVLAPFGPMVTPEIKALVAETTQKLVKDPGAVWDGPIYDTAGTLRVKAGERLDEKGITEMMWYADGVITAMKNK